MPLSWTSLEIEIDLLIENNHANHSIELCLIGSYSHHPVQYCHYLPSTPTRISLDPASYELLKGSTTDLFLKTKGDILLNGLLIFRKKIYHTRKLVDQQIIIVDNVIDSAPNITFCDPTFSSGKCNVRSAIHYCFSLEVISSPCTISLPPKQVLSLNPIYGQLRFQNINGHVLIQGNDCTIFSTNEAIFRFLEIKVDPAQFICEFFVFNLTLRGFSSTDGGAIKLTGVTSSIMDNLSFISNQGTYGGALYLESCSEIFIKNSHFLGNTALWGGGAICIYKGCKNITLHDIRVINNTAIGTESGGGGVFIHSQNANILLEGLTIINNTASTGGGLYIFSNNRQLTLTNSTISSNFANSFGGGIYINGENEHVSICGTNVSHNLALLGGGLYTQDGNSYLSFNGNRFQGNKALQGEGGAIVFSLDVSYVVISNTFFINNTAYTSGGAVSMMRSTLITFENCQFWYNRAISNGGALYVTNVDNLRIISSQFVSNHANSGGSIFLQTSVNSFVDFANFINNTASSLGGALLVGSYNTNITWISCTFNRNIANYGGAITFLDYNSQMNISHCNFQSNLAENGGAVYNFLLGDEFTFQHCQFVSNYAEGSGGAVYSEGFMFTSFQDTKFNSNRAHHGDGGSLYFQNSQNIVFRYCDFARNVAANGGGSLAIVELNENIVVLNSEFYSDEAFSGGSLYCSTNNKGIVLVNCTFLQSFASIGAAAFFHEYNEQILFSDSYFSSLQSIYAGGVLANKNNRNITLNNCTFDSNVAFDGGASALLIYSENEDVDIINCRFRWNLAVRGSGAVTFYEKNYDLTIVNSTFLLNTAQIGGALVFNFLNYRIQILTSKFRSNHGTNGAIYANYRNENLLIDGSEFFNNVMTFGGGIYLDTENRDTKIQNCIFYLNIVLNAGGGIYIKDNNMLVRLFSSTFIYNVAHVYGSALSLRTGNSILTILDCVFGNNTAFSSGGAIHSALYNDLTIQSSSFHDNVAMIYGGGIYFGEDHEGVAILESKFYRNDAQRGGGLYVSRSNHDLEIKDTSFQENSAFESGGALYLLSNFVQISQSNFVGNFAHLSGGGISISASEIDFNNCLWDHNVATTSGGAAHLQDSLIITFSGCRFLANNATFGSGVGLFSSSNVIVFNSSFTNHYSSKGTLFLDNSLNVTTNKTKFSNNLANVDGGAIMSQRLSSYFSFQTIYNSNRVTFNGGAICSSQSTRLEIIHSTFWDNIAQNGSGSAIWISETPSIFINNSFHSNSAPTGAGCVFWEYLSDINSPLGLNNFDNNFLSNSALYGANLATNGMQLFLPEGPRYNITTYSTYLPEIPILLLDVYNQTVLTASDSIASISVMTQYSQQPSTCYDGVGYVSGGIFETIHAGILNFSTLQAHCAPGYEFGLNIFFQAPLSTNFIDLTQTLSLYFRKCMRGEYYNAKMCILCQNGTYSLADNQNLNAKSCTRCPEHSVDCYGDKINVKPGYWRINADAITLQQCPQGEVSCLGGWGIGLDLCGLGYEGPLCSVCSVNYFKSSQNSCEKCTNGRYISDPLVIVMIVIAILVLFLVVLFIAYPEIKLRQIANSLIQMKSSLIRLMIRGGNSMKDTEEYLSQFLRRFQGRLKIYLVTYQLIAVFPFVLDLTYPDNVSGLLTSLDILNLSASHSSSLSCSLPSLDYIDYLLIETIFPIVFLLLLFCIYLVHWFHSLYMVKSRTSDPLYSSYFAVALCFLYLIFPGVSTTIFRTFSCRDVDPDNVTDEEDYYLRSDYSISCHSSRYKFGVIWAIFMIFVYPLGIPFTFFLFLYSKQAQISTRDISVSDLSITFDSGQIVKDTQFSLKYLPDRLLYGNYRPECWYWEIIECYYRVMFSGFLVLIQQGSLLQIIIGILILLFFFKLYSIFQPYHDSFQASLKEISFWQLYSLLFLSLLLKVDVVLIDKVTIDVVFFLVILGNIIIELFRQLILGMFGYDIYLFKIAPSQSFAPYETSSRLSSTPGEVHNPFQVYSRERNHPAPSHSISSQRSISSLEMESCHRTDVHSI